MLWEFQFCCFCRTILKNILVDGFSPFLGVIGGGSLPLYFSPVNKQTCNFGGGVGERGSMVTRREMFSLRSLTALAQAPHTERITTSRRTHG